MSIQSGLLHAGGVSVVMISCVARMWGSTVVGLLLSPMFCVLMLGGKPGCCLHYQPGVTNNNTSAKFSEEYVVVEGDIAMTMEDYLSVYKDSRMRHSRLQTELIDGEFIPIYPKSHTKRRNRRAVSSLKSRLWPNALVPYVIGPNITDVVKRNIHFAMSHWEKHTCLRFLKRTNQTDYIYMNPGPCGCCSFVGRRGGRQWVTLSPHCAVYGVIIHELGHVVGFWHEHSRPDRDRYIKIVRQNIMAGKADNFARKSHLEIDSLGQPYDYYSVMHYRQKTFSKNNKNTIETLDPNVRIGQRVSLSPGDVVQANLLYKCPKPKCNDEFTKMKGNFTTPNYPIKYLKEHKCTWIIHVSAGEIVSLQFHDFAIERSENCVFDYVEIRQGVDGTGNLIGRLCGEGQPGIINSAESLWIRFKSDSSLALRGFAANFIKQKIGAEEFSGSGSGEGSGEVDLHEYGLRLYDPDCNSYLTAPMGTVMSPLSLIGQTDGLECSWTIDGGSNASRILMTFDLQMASEDQEHCAGSIYQKVTHRIRHHPGKSNSLHHGHVTRDNNKDVHKEDVTYFSHDEYRKVRYDCLKSNKLLLKTGTARIDWSSLTTTNFKMSYIIDYNECALHTSRCQHECHNTMRGYVCSCFRGYRLASNGWSCTPKIIETSDRCGGNLTSTRGQILAGTEPLRNCQWRIKFSSHYRITLTFSKFHLPLNENCSRNYIEILTGRDMKSRGRYCGTKGPPEISSHSGLMTILLHTDLKWAKLMPFFSAEYIAQKQIPDRVERCFYRLKANSVIMSPKFPGKYPPNLVCTWRLSARKGHKVKIHFEVFDVEKTKQCKFDFLEIRDGRHRTSPVIGRFCGKKIPPTITTTGRHIWLRFITDTSGSGLGFKISGDQVPKS